MNRCIKVFKLKYYPTGGYWCCAEQGPLKVKYQRQAQKIVTLTNKLHNATIHDLPQYSIINVTWLEYKNHKPHK